MANKKDNNLKIISTILTIYAILWLIVATSTGNIPLLSTLLMGTVGGITALGIVVESAPYVILVLGIAGILLSPKK